MSRVEKLEIDFYKELKLPPAMCGLVNKIISPKGLRKLNDKDRYEYRLRDELIQIYDGKPAEVEPGMYWVMDVYKNKEDELTWNHYIVIVEEDCFYPVAQFLGCKDSTWIKEAIPYIKRYFAGDDVEPIEIEPYKRPQKVKTGWKSSY